MGREEKIQLETEPKDFRFCDAMTAGRTQLHQLTGEAVMSSRWKIKAQHSEDIRLVVACKCGEVPQQPKIEVEGEEEKDLEDPEFL